MEQQVSKPASQLTFVLHHRSLLTLWRFTNRIIIIIIIIAAIIIIIYLYKNS